jgi:hypothetical protein
MNLKQAIDDLNSGSEPYLTMYFVFKGEDTPILRRVDIEKEVQNQLAAGFTKFLTENYAKKDLKIGKVSTADDRKLDFLEYDIEIIAPLDVLARVLEKPEVQKYSYAKDKDHIIDGYIFIIGNENVKISLYKEHYPFDTIARDSFVIFGRSDSRFVSIKEDDVFKLNNKIDFVQVGNRLYVLNLKVMESNFKIHTVLKRKAELALVEIDKKRNVENMAFLKEIINENPAFARKVLRVNLQSPVIKLPFGDIKKFVQGHPHLTGKLKFNSKGNKFKLHSKSAATLFIKLMDDDFLKSELSQKLYDSITKDQIDSEVEGN